VYFVVIIVCSCLCLLPELINVSLFQRIAESRNPLYILEVIGETLSHTVAFSGYRAFFFIGYMDIQTGEPVYKTVSGLTLNVTL